MNSLHELLADRRPYRERHPIIYLILSFLLTFCFAVVATWGVRVGMAGATEPVNAMVTHYDNHPGKSDSISAVCHERGIKFGFHPWDHSTRNFQIIDSEGNLLVNANPTEWKTYFFPVGDYTIRYAGHDYEVSGDRCATQPTTTTASTTTTSVAPTTTTGSSTTTSSEPTTTTAPAEETTTSSTPGEASTTSTPVAGPIPVDSPTSTTSHTTPIPVELITSTADELPVTGFPLAEVLFVGITSILVGVFVSLVVASVAKKRFDYQKD